jgi:hypothetical protein
MSTAVVQGRPHCEQCGRETPLLIAVTTRDGKRSAKWCVFCVKAVCRPGATWIRQRGRK